jgi:hypothetical protein
MSSTYRRHGGFPIVPLWAAGAASEPRAWNDVEQAALGQRLVVLAAERIAFWELDHLLRLTHTEGVPVLPVTFSNDRVVIGPLIIGANVTAFYLSRFGSPIVDAPQALDAAKVLCMSQRFEGQQIAVITEEILHMAEAMSDESCVSAREIRENAQVLEHDIDLRWRILDSRLEGSLWSLNALLNPHVVSDHRAWHHAADHLQKGGVLSIESAFRTDVANTMHRSLLISDKWKLHEEIHPLFFYHHHNIYNTADLSPTMLIASLIFASRPTIDWAASLVGSDCSGAVQQSASWYMPGDHSTPHSDAALRRKLAFVWHLTADWDNSWGGHLICLRSDTIIPVAFNTLHLFDTRKSGSHCVMQVAPSAGGKRLAWNGWWTSRDFEPDGPKSEFGKGTSQSDGLFRFR